MKKINRFLTFVLVLSLLVSSFAGGFTAKASAEETSTRVYFYNSDNWAKVNAYVFNASNGEALGTWPGKAATNGGDGWWYVDVPAAPQFMIIFNNGSGFQTKDVPISDASSVYVTISGKTFSNKAAAEASVPSEPVSTKVWFYNSDNWAAVNAYVFGATNGQALGNWPGKAATNGGDGWWYVEVPAVPQFSIIFNNGSGSQTGDIVIANEANVYVTVNNAVFASKEAAEGSLSAEPVSTKVWFYNSNSWDAVNAYVFGTSNSKDLGAWPGTAATREGESDWWYVEVPAEPQFTIIFNGSGAQTGDIVIGDKSNVYVTVNNAVFASKEAAEASFGGGEDPEIPEPASTTVWFYNSDNWENVNAYVFGASNGEALGTWPGSAATRDGETDWWYVEVPADPQFTIIFNGSGAQTGDIVIADEANVYVTVNDAVFTTKEAAEASFGGGEDPEIPEPVSTTVWFYNSNNWETVNAYVFGASNGEALGTWPGSAATRDGESDWWYVVVPADPAFSIIFNGSGFQTKDVSISDKTNLYVTVSGDTFADKTSAEEAVAGTEPANTKVWFYNSDNWETVNAYVFGASNGEALGTWPGSAATRDGESDWWYVDVSADPQFSIIFNNGSGAQTGDIVIADETNVYVTVNDAVFASKEAAEASFGGGEDPEIPEPVSTTVWFYNSNNWETVNAYVFGASNGEALGTWPGSAATRDGESDWWYVVVPADPAFSIVFNGSGFQTKDVSISDKTNLYVTVGGNTFADKETAEESVANAEPANTKVWFYNSNNWENIKAYVFGASNGEALGTWPGTAATRDGESDWWYVEVPADPAFSIIFNGSGFQTKDVSISDKTNLYVTVSGDTFADKTSAEEAVASTEPANTKVWFYNSDNWETVNAYVFGASNGEALGTWPGSAATRDGETSWWYVEVPANPEFSIIFNNGSGAQTLDVTILDKAQAFVTVTGPEPYADKETAEEAQKEMDEDRKGSIRLWFYNSEGWARVRAYIFGASNGEVLGGWPGKAATRDGDRWWYIDVEADRPFYVIFNNGSNAQTADIQITDSTHVYVTKDGVYATKEEAEESIPNLKPFVSASTTVWFYNSLGWENVCAYAWGTYNADPLGRWPGSQAIRYEDTDWWYITCPFPAPFDIIFNDGREGGAQTQGVRITNSWNVYTTYQANMKYSSREAAEAAVGGNMKVYFYNTNGWSEVYAYTWGGVRGEEFGAWPGMLATRESEDSYWYYVEVLAGTHMNIIFSNGEDEQTSDVTVDDSKHLYITVKGEKFATKEDAEATITHVREINPEKTEKNYMLWFYNSEHWENVYIYLEDVEGKNLFGNEPGIRMHRQGESDWYFVNVTTDPNFTVKFSDGGTVATDVFTVVDEENVYFTAQGQFASKDAVLEALGESSEPAPGHTAQNDPAAGENGSGLGGVVIGGGAILTAAIGACVVILNKKRGKKSAA